MSFIYRLTSDRSRVRLTWFERTRRTGFNGTDRDQWHTQITHFFKQSMQCGLVNHGSGKKRIAAFLLCDGQAFKLMCPLMIQMSLDPDLIDHGLI